MATYDHADRHYPRTLAPVERPSLRRSPTAMRTPTSRALEAFAAAPAYEAQRDALPDYDASAPIAALPTSTVSSIMPISTVFSNERHGAALQGLHAAENEEDASAPPRSLTGAEIKALGKCSNVSALKKPLARCDKGAAKASGTGAADDESTVDLTRGDAEELPLPKLERDRVIDLLNPGNGTSLGLHGLRAATFEDALRDLHDGSLGPRQEDMGRRWMLECSLVMTARRSTRIRFAPSRSVKTRRLSSRRSARRRTRAGEGGGADSARAAPRRGRLLARAQGERRDEHAVARRIA